MGRYTGTPPVTPSLTNQGPIGGIVSMIRSGTDYKAIGEVISRTAFSAFSALFPRIGSFLATTGTSANTGKFKSMAYGLGLFIAVGPDSAGVATSAYVYSRDGGKTWLNANFPASFVYRHILFTGTQFVATGNGAIYASTDGFNWTAKTVPAGLGDIIFYGNGLYLTAGTGSTMYTSPDLTTWTARALPTSGPWSLIAYSGSMFVATTYNSTAAASSPDGITWTARTISAAAGYTVLTFGNGLFVAMGVASSLLVTATSPDGIVWTSRTAPTGELGAGWTSAVFGNGLFFAICQASLRAAVSFDGITWTEKGTAVTGSSNMTALAYGNGTFVALYQTNCLVAYAENTTDSDLMYLSGTAGQYVRVK